MISKDELAGIIYDKMTTMLLTSWPYTSVCTRCVSGKQPTQATDFSTLSESTKIKYGINEFQGQLIEHMMGDKIAAKHNKRRICWHYGYVPQEHVHLCDNGMQPAVLYVWVTAQQTCVQPGLFHVLQSRGLFIHQGKIDEAHLEGQISHSQQDVFKPGPKSNPNDWNPNL